MFYVDYVLDEFRPFPVGKHFYVACCVDGVAHISYSDEGCWDLASVELRLIDKRDWRNDMTTDTFKAGPEYDLIRNALIGPYREDIDALVRKDMEAQSQRLREIYREAAE